MYKTKYSAQIIVIGLAFLIGFAAVSYAAVPIKIARPVDGSTVREVVNILVPIGCVPAGGFVSYSINGRFKAASASLTENEDNFVYRWNTKAMDPDTSIPAEQRKPKDGKYTLTVQAYDSSNKKVGSEKSITVNVKNDASSNMPKGGISLKYSYKNGAAAKYNFRYTVNIKSVQGAINSLLTPDSAAEGGEFLIKRDVEEIITSSSVLVRSRFVGIPKRAFNGKLVPQYSMTASSQYQYESVHGAIDDVAFSLLAGQHISVYLPELSQRKLKIGDTWTTRDAVFRDPYTGRETVMDIKNTLLGLEWEGGYPCAKIKSTFSGMGRIPYSTMASRTSPVSGETITYFAFTAGKLISSSTTATVQADIDMGTVTRLGVPGMANRGSGMVPAELLVEQKISLAR